MYSIITYEETLALANPIYIDVRSASEHQQERIPGSLNLPILDDEERQIVGTTYVNESREKAKLLGVQFVSPKIPEYFAVIQELLKAHEVVIYCKTGGYRSGSLVSLLQSLGEKVYQLDNGYKGYRRFVLNELERLTPQFTFVNLSGLSGTGKTEILQQLKQHGAQVIDLEGLANHRGSKFGQIGKNPIQPTQKNFESALYEALRSFDRPTVFIEAESQRIGKLIIQPFFYQAYSNSPHQVHITAPISDRVHRIYQEYIVSQPANHQQEIIAALKSAARYLGNQTIADYIEKVKQGQYHEVIEGLLVNHYDKCYKTHHSGYELTIENRSNEETALKLLAVYP